MIRQLWGHCGLEVGRVIHQLEDRRFDPRHEFLIIQAHLQLHYILYMYQRANSPPPDHEKVWLFCKCMPSPCHPVTQPRIKNLLISPQKPFDKHDEPSVT